MVTCSTDKYVAADKYFASDHNFYKYKKSSGKEWDEAMSQLVQIALFGEAAAFLGTLSSNSASTQIVHAAAAHAIGA